MSRKVLVLLAALATLALALSACAPAEPEIVTVVETQEVTVVETQEVQVAVSFQMESARLEAVKNNGVLRCGVNSGVPGFGFLDESGDFTGFDTDFCRAIAVAIFNDPSAVEFRPLTAAGCASGRTAPNQR